MKQKLRSPYQALLSPKGRTNAEITRNIYMHELPLKRTAPARSIESEEYRKFHSSSRHPVKDLHLSLNRHANRSQDKQLFSDRKNS